MQPSGPLRASDALRTTTTANPGWPDAESQPIGHPASRDSVASAGIAGGYATRVRGLLHARWQAIAAFALLLASVEAARAWAGTRGDAREFAALLFAWLLTEILTVGLGAVLGPVLAEALGWYGWRRALVTVAMTFAAVGIGIAAIVAFAGDLLAAQVRAGAIVSVEAFALSVLWFFSMAGLLFAAYANVHDREIATARAAQDAELGRAEAERVLMESRLKVLQARVEPEFLFGALEQVHALYRRTPATAERMLDELILYLRAALPRMRGEVSTIDGEFDLVRAYLAVLQMPFGERLGVEIRGDPGISAQRFPPMVLLPLVQGAMVDGGAWRRRIGIYADAGGEAVTITISVEGGARPDTWCDDGLAGVREPLQITCGADCAIAVASEGERHSATIVIPLHAASLRQT